MQRFHLTQEEIRLIDMYRCSDARGKRSIMKHTSFVHHESQPKKLNLVLVRSGATLLLGDVDNGALPASVSATV